MKLILEYSYNLITHQVASPNTIPQNIPTD